jgi:predicted transposase YbfD/YdcC
MNDPLVEMLSCVTDARREQAKRYGLANILLFCIFGFLCGAKSYKTLCSFIEERFALLQAAFPSKMKRAPALSTVWRIIGLVDGGTLETVFRSHAASQHAALGGGQGQVVAHDGKSLKGSYDTAGDKKMSQLLRAFAMGTKIILGHVAILVKSNEIPAMQALVRELGLAGVLCTADAMHCQIKTIKAVKASGGEALLQVKGNQPSLAAAFEALPTRHEPEDCQVETGKRGRNRQESARSRCSRQAAFWICRNGGPRPSRRFASPARFSARMSPPAGNGSAPTKSHGMHRPRKATAPHITPPRRAAIGAWRTASTTYWTSRCTRTPAVSAKAPPSSPSYAASPSTSCGSTRSTTLPTPCGATP